MPSATRSTRGPGRRVSTGQTSAWFFGEPLEPASATLVLAHAAGPGTFVRLGTLSADGSTRWSTTMSVATGATSVTGALPQGAAVGLREQVIGSLPAQRAVITVGGRPYELGGSLSSALVPGPWQQAGFAQGYAVFTLRAPPVPISASTLTGRPLPVEVVSSATKSEQIRVSTPSAATVIRSVAWDSGWSATVSVNGGKARNIPVGSFDLVQQVHVPAGNDLVTFRYRPPHLLAASVLTIGASALLVVLLVVWLVRRRRPGTGEQVSPRAHAMVADVPEHVG